MPGWSMLMSQVSTPCKACSRDVCSLVGLPAINDSESVASSANNRYFICVSVENCVFLFDATGANGLGSCLFSDRCEWRAPPSPCDDQRQGASHTEVNGHPRHPTRKACAKVQNESQGRRKTSRVDRKVRLA